MEMKDAKKCATCARSFDECSNLYQDGRRCSTGNEFAEWKPKQPAREPQCKTRADLFREFARVLEMCGNDISMAVHCIRFGLMIQTKIDDMLNSLARCVPEHAEFALAIVEGKPVWRGDVLWSGFFNCFVEITGLIPGGGYLSFASDNPDANCSIASCSWNPPKPATISINGMEVPAPLNNKVWVARRYGGTPEEYYEVQIRYKIREDADVTIAALEGRKP